MRTVAAHSQVLLSHAPLFASAPAVFLEHATSLGMSFLPPGALVVNVRVDPHTGEAAVTPTQLAALLKPSRPADAGLDLLAAGIRFVHVFARSNASGAASAGWVPVSSPGAAQSQSVEGPLVTAMLARPFPGGTACVEAR